MDRGVLLRYSNALWRAYRGSRYIGLWGVLPTHDHHAKIWQFVMKTPVVRRG
jgi:hypothetical protein